jgi:NDP-sugar pyrophosphorylase family protein
MVPVSGEPFVSRQLKLLARESVSDVVFCVGHNAQPLIEFIGNGAHFGLRVDYSFDGPTLLGTAGAVKSALTVVQALAPTRCDFAVLYGDSYLDIPFAPIYEAFTTSGKLSLMTVYRNENQLIKSNILYRDGSIISYHKSPSAPPGMAHVDFGLSFYRREVFDKIDEFPCDLSTVTQALIANDQLAGYEVHKRFYEVGTPEGVHDLEAYLAELST